MAKTRSRRARPSARKVKLHRSYQIEEAARVTGACRATVRRWIKDGLHIVRDTRPPLILGGDLIHYLDRKTGRQKCQPTECFCLKCRAPRRMAGGMADFMPMTERGGNLRALCDVCGTLMHKRISSRTLEVIRPEIEVTIMERRLHLKGKD